MVVKGIVGWIEVSVDSWVYVPGCVWGAIPGRARAERRYRSVLRLAVRDPAQKP